MNMRAFNRAVRAAIMPKYVYRMRFLAFTITQGTDTVLPLLICDDDPDYNQLIDGTTAAEVAPGSRILALQLHFQVVLGSDNEIVEWVLMKNPDNDLSTAESSIAALYTQDVSAETRTIRKNAIAAGHFIMDSNHGTPEVRVNVSRKALARVGPIQDTDRLNMVFTMTAATGNTTLYGRGRIITRQA